jgi:hypothetical protein
MFWTVHQDRGHLWRSDPFERIAQFAFDRRRMEIQGFQVDVESPKGVLLGVGKQMDVRRKKVSRQCLIILGINFDHLL